MTGFTVQPESFAPAAAQMRDAAVQLQDAWAPVRAASQGVHYGSGTDLVSPLIQASLAGAVSQVESCVASSARALASYADGLEAMGRTYSATEDATTAMFTAR